jgi:hypothetical protein
MAENKNKIIVYRDWINTFDSLTDDEAGKLIKHFFRYINDLNPEPPDRIIKLLFEPIKQTLKRDLKRYESTCLKNKNNVNIRWNKKDTTEYDRIPTDTNHTDSDSDSDSDIKKEYIRKKVFVKPTIEEVMAYCDERKNDVNPISWYNHYEATGWMIGKNKMKDWKAAVRTWEKVRATAVPEFTSGGGR